MELLIDTDLVATFPVDPSSTADEFAEISAVCRKLGVQHIISLGTTIGSTTVFTIPVQKITLDSVDVNELLADVFYLLDYDIKYAALGGCGHNHLPGGCGCDLTLAITNKGT